MSKENWDECKDCQHELGGEVPVGNAGNCIHCKAFVRKTEAGAECIATDQWDRLDSDTKTALVCGLLEEDYPLLLPSESDDV